MGKYFGTDGFRGEANVNLTVEHAFKVGRYIGYYYGRGHKARIIACAFATILIAITYGSVLLMNLIIKFFGTSRKIKEAE